MHGYYSFKSSDEEKRKLRIHNDVLVRSLQKQKENKDRLEGENHKLKQEIRRIEKERQKVQEELEKVKRERDTYKEMVFKANKKQEGVAEITDTKRKIGGQIGHKGYGRKTTDRIDRQVAAYLSNCPDCDSPLKETPSTRRHIVTDIPHWKELQPITTEYSIQRQWCSNCHTEVQAVPKGVIPRSKLGMNLVTMILVWKYRFRNPLNKIAENLETMYGLHVSEGTIVYQLHKAQTYLGDRYADLLAEIRGAPIKHADETGWRINGENSWAWVFLSKKSTYYTIEETRGKGIPEEKLEDAVGVLVRDDYGGYKKLPIEHQSCWAHLLRKSHEASVREEASEEVKKLHHQLKNMFDLLQEDVVKPFTQNERNQWYLWYTKDIEKIIATHFTSQDAKQIQTRIKNQTTNLLTALLYPDVPLTNNPAEKAIRPLVVTRKISGGSKTKEGAKTHAVNMSIIETICKQKLPLLDTLQTYLLQASTVSN